MKRKIIVAVVLALGVSALSSCSAIKTDSESTSADDILSSIKYADSTDDLSSVNVKVDSRVPMKAGECEIYLDSEHDSDKQDGDSVLYYKDSDLVMKKTYSAGKLVSKSIYGDYEVNFTYSYDSNNLLTEVSASGEAGDGSFTKIKIRYRSDSSISSYAYFKYDKQSDNYELYTYDFDSDGNVTKGFDNYEAYSEALNGAILGGIGLS